MWHETAGKWRHHATLSHTNTESDCLTIPNVDANRRRTRWHWITLSVVGPANIFYDPHLFRSWKRARASGRRGGHTSRKGKISWWSLSDDIENDLNYGQQNCQAFRSHCWVVWLPFSVSSICSVCPPQEARQWWNLTGYVTHTSQLRVIWFHFFVDPDLEPESPLKEL